MGVLTRRVSNYIDNSYIPANAQIYADHLIHLLQSCASLSCLSISQDQSELERPCNVDITNSYVEALARNAVNLRHLYLLFRALENHGSTRIYSGELALRSLAQHCTRLERLWLTCDPSWRNLVSTSDRLRAV